MAKVISWYIDGKYAYLRGETQGPQFLDNELSSGDTAALGAFWRNKSLSDYRIAFGEMKEYVERAISGQTSLGVADNYFNVLGLDGVIVVSGRDGKNIYEESLPYYNLHVANENLSIGLGGDYELDTAVTAKTQVYLEHDGVIVDPSEYEVRIETVDSGAYTYNTFPNVLPGFTDVELYLPIGVEFKNDTHCNKYKLYVTLRGYTAIAYFSITGVKSGKEGEVYNLNVTPKIVKKLQNGGYSSNLVNLSIVRNGEEFLPTDDVYIFYNTLSGETKAGPSISSFVIDTLEDKTLTFYLSYYGTVIDTETCTIVKDGDDSAMACWVELDNEMDGISLGDSNSLMRPMTVGSGAKIFTGSTEGNISRIILSGISLNERFDCFIKYGNNDWEQVYYTDGKFIYEHSPEYQYAEFKLTFPSGFTFGENLKEVVSVTIEGTNGISTFTASTNYVVLAIKGGKNGEVYRLQTSCNYVLYDPNSEDQKFWPVDGIVSCKAFVGVEEIVTGETQTGFSIFYSIDEIYDTVEQDMQVGDAQLFSENKFVVFYLFYTSDGINYFLLDRETVPIVKQGQAGAEKIFLELDEEMTGVAIGGDNRLDSEVIVEIPFAVYKGNTQQTFQSVSVVADSAFNDHVCVLDMPGGVKTGRFENSVVYFTELAANSATLKINLSGLTFDSSYRKEVSLTVFVGDYTYTSVYTIIGIKDGKDGAVYKLVPSDSVIVADPNEYPVKFTPNILYCDAYFGTQKIYDLGENEKYWIKYSINDDPEIMPYYPSEGLQIQETFHRVYFYLLLKDDINWIVIDRESVPVVSNGIDAEDRVFLELDDEMTGIGVGGNGILDKETEINVSFSLYSGASKINFTKVYVESSDSSFNNIECVLSYDESIKTGIFENKVIVFNNILTSTATLSFTLPIGFSFDTNRKQLLFKVTDDAGEHTDMFTIIGVESGADGVVYRLVPESNAILYNPNTHEYLPNHLKCEAYCGGEPISAESYEIRYTTGNTPQTEYSDTYSYAETLPEGVNINSQNRVYFYLFHNQSEMIDRESVPVISDGLNASEKIFLELDEEMTGIAIGSDNVLDVVEPIKIDVPIILYSGTQKCGFTEVEVSGDSSINDICSCAISYTGETGAPVVFHDGKVIFIVPAGIATTITGCTLSVYLGDGLTFSDNSGRKVLKITAKSGTTLYQSTFTIVGVPGGVDGTSYRIVPRTSSIIVNPNTNPYTVEPTTVFCDAYNGTNKIPESEIAINGDEDKQYWIKYTINFDTDNINLMTGYNPNIGVLVPANIIRIHFYLLIKNGESWKIIDKEGVPGIKEGLDADDRTFLELDEEMTGVGLGGDNKIDKPATINVPFSLYSGSSTVNFTSVKVSVSDSSFNYIGAKLSYTDTAQTREFLNNEVIFSNLTASTANLEFTLSAGFVFSTNRKELTFRVTGETGEEFVARYTIIGVESGADGSVYRLVPEVSSVIYDPNTEAYLPSSVKCTAYDGISSVGNNFEIKYSVGISSAATTGSTDMHVIPSTGVAPEVGKRIYFYLLLKNGDERIVVDMETVPVGINGETIYYLDLDNQNASVNCDLNGDILPGAILPSCKATLYFGHSEATGVTYSISGHQEVTISSSGVITLPQNLSFSGDKLVLTVTATVSAGSYQAKYTITKNYPGENGAPGEPGLPGPAVRGPISWYSGITENRRFCNGVGPLASDANFIDIILKDDVFYKCSISYNATPNDSWNSVSSAWTASDAAYNFIATSLLLAQNARIDFQSSNALYLMSGDTVTGGAAGGSGTTVAFWAGSSNPNNAPFKVDHNGKLSATGAEISGSISADTGYFKGSLSADTGYFAGSIRVPYVRISSLGTQTGTYGTGYYAGYNAYLSLNTTTTTINNKKFTVRGYNGASVSTTTQLGPAIYLPKPNSSLNGFTYRILVAPGLLTTRFDPPYDPTLLIGVLGSDTSERINILDYSHADAIHAGGSIIGFYGGHLEITCMLDDNDRYRWIITNCSGALSFFADFGSDQTVYHECYRGSVSDIYSYSWNNFNDMIRFMHTAAVQDSSGNDTMFIQKTW